MLVSTGVRLQQFVRRQATEQNHLFMITAPAAVFDNPVYFVVFVKKDVAASYGAYIRVFSNGSPSVNASIKLNVADGSYSEYNTTNVAVELIGVLLESFF